MRTSVQRLRRVASMGSMLSKGSSGAAPTPAEVGALVPGGSSVAPVATPLGGNGHGLQLPVPLFESGRFDNPAHWGWEDKGFTDLMKWKREGGPPPRPSEQEIREVTGYQTPDLAAWASPAAGALQHTWLGHASYLVQLGGANLLFDPVFSSRCSPIQLVGPKRALPTPATIEQLPVIDAVLISHNHYDHLDHNSIEALAARGVGKWLVPAGLGAWFKSEVRPRIDHADIIEMSWWEESGALRGLRVMYTPAKHWTTRGVLDKNTSLWGSWAVWEVHSDSTSTSIQHPPLQEPEPEPLDAGIPVDITAVQISAPPDAGPVLSATEASEATVERVGLALWFSGDTGYCDAFETIGAYFRWRFGRQLPFSLAIIGIGACKHPAPAVQPRSCQWARCQWARCQRPAQLAIQL